MVRKSLSGEGQIDLFGGGTERTDHAVETQEPVLRQPPAPDLPDRAARERIVRDLELNLLVEAGAGAGKTTEMVNRMIALVDAGERVERIAAVTFTRKAAAELRERFQISLEAKLHACADEARRERFDAALRNIDRAFLGTIHAFCARLLRERPLDAGLDPGFHEVFGPEQKRLQRRYWSTFIERAAAAGEPLLATLRRVALTPAQIYPLFEQLVENPDVEYPAPDVPQPDASSARTALEDLLDRGGDIIPAREPEKGWDRLQSMIRQLRFHRRLGWSDDVVFLDAIARTFTSTPKLQTQNRYRDTKGGVAAARVLEAAFQAFVDPDGPGGQALTQWRAHRYPIAIGLARAGAEAFAEERRRNGTLFFADLLVLAARLLRAQPNARRELGERYRRVLVDEFQDTDPLQAEVLLLLASEPKDGDDWQSVTPRPGALFVVGDPKQSIYRFRRADIALYGRVRERFRTFGDVLELVSNFRSRPPIETFVNAVFEQRFPALATDEQAAFAPMRVRRPDTEHQGVFGYRLEQNYRAQDDTANEDAERIASWVAARIDSGERVAGDFLVLTRTRKFLGIYGKALEARNVPVQVTGAGLGIETELSELLLLLSALADPNDSSLTLAALVGLFFGLDYEQLAAHVLDGNGRIAFTHPADAPQTDVERALAKLNEWWRMSRREPADVTVARIVNEHGLLPYAAGGALGESRAGALLHVLDAVRRAALEGDATLNGAIAAIEAALENDEAEAPLEPGRTDVLRLMNLHQAKGLEAPVVVLAAPVGVWAPPVTQCIVRDAAGHARGWTLVAERREGWGKGTNIFAAPADWETYVAGEAAFEAAEEDRLLYVACTRAGDELVIARPAVKEEDSPWCELYPHLDGGTGLELPLTHAPPRAVIERSSAEIAREIAETDALRAALTSKTHHFGAVTARVKGDAPPVTVQQEADSLLPRPPRGRGTGWGTAVHGALEAAARGESGERLRSIARALLVAAERPLLAGGEPVELDELVELVHAVATSDLWKSAARAARGGHVLVEVPFALALPSDDFIALMSRAGAPAEAVADPAPLEIIEGVIDLAFRTDAGWVLVDYKSDAAATRIEVWRRTRYRAQVGLYAAAWERITGEPVTERVLLYTATGDTDRW